MDVNSPAFMAACKKIYLDKVRKEAFPSHLEAILSSVGPDGSLTIRDTSPEASCRVLPSPLSELEAKFYYAGLSGTPLVARTSTTPWEIPTSPETYQRLQELRAILDKPSGLDWEAEIASKRDELLDSMKLKELHPADSHHQLKEVWEGNLSRKVITILDSMGVKWNSIDVVRIGYAGEHPYPAVIWIGVTPRTLSGDDGAAVVSECHKLLVEHDITDVEVEIRESIIWPQYVIPLLSSVVALF